MSYRATGDQFQVLVDEFRIEFPLGVVTAIPQGAVEEPGLVR